MDELYVIARRVLLDVLEALGPHRDATILVGAQAIYLHTGDAELAVAEYTTDADLALDPDSLNEIPPLEQALEAGGFTHMGSRGVGVWKTRRMQADERSGATARRGLALLGELFGHRGNEGATMAVRATQLLMDEQEVRLSCEVLAGDLLDALRPQA